MLYQAEPDPEIECKWPPSRVAEALRSLLNRELPNEHRQGPPIIRDTVSGEQGLYFWTPVDVDKRRGVYVVRIRGKVLEWDGTQYVPQNILDDILEIRLSKDGTGGSLARVVPAFDLHGFDDHIRALIADRFGRSEMKTQPQRRDSGHFAHSYEGRRKIVAEYRKGRATGTITNKAVWAKGTYHISDSTLRAYEEEFPETEA